MGRYISEAALRGWKDPIIERASSPLASISGRALIRGS